MTNKFSTGATIGVSAFIIAVLLLLINFGIIPIISERPDYPGVPCDPAKGPLSPTGCGTEFDAAQATYQQAVARHETIVFWTSIISGIALLVAGFFLLRSLPVATAGVMIAGAAQLVIGTMSYWEHLNKYATFGLLLGAAVVLFGMIWRFTKR